MLGSKGFGRSLFIDVTEHYLPDVVLQGTTEQNAVNRIHCDLTMSVKVNSQTVYVNT